GRVPDLTAALLARGKELESSGYHVQVHMEERTSLFFLMENGRRTALRRSGDAYHAANGTTYSTAELLERLDRRPDDFSPNALLRPVVQDFLLPTMAYIGGPAQLAYLAQAEGLYGRLPGTVPVAATRATFTILDARAEKLLKRYGLDIRDVLHGPAHMEERIAGVLVPDRMQQTFQSSHHQIESALATVERDLLSFDPTLAAALGK